MGIPRSTCARATVDPLTRTGYAHGSTERRTGGTDSGAATFHPACGAVTKYSENFTDEQVAALKDFVIACGPRMRRRIPQASRIVNKTGLGMVTGDEA